MKPRPTVRRAEIEAEAKALLEHMEHSGLSPLEGLTAIETLYSLLLLRGMDAAAGNQAVIDEAKAVSLRSIDRMMSRVMAWPARTADRQ